MKLKEDLTQPPVLALPNLSLPFIIECDALKSIIEVVLMQRGKPIAFFSQALKGKVLALSTYEKELYTLVTVVQKWRPYLLRHPFMVKTDHQSLKYLLEHKIGTSMQHKWVSKLLGYDMLVEYKKGQDNKEANALSRKLDSEMPGVEATVELLEKVKEGYQGDPKVQELLLKFQQGGLPSSYSIIDTLVFYKQRLLIGRNKAFKQKLLALLHTSLMSGHSRYEKTMH